MAALCFLSLCSLSVKGVAAEELNRARGGHGCCSGGDEQGRGRGNRGRWVLAVSLRGSFRFQVQCLPPFGRLQYGKSFLDVQTIKKRVCECGRWRKQTPPLGSGCLCSCSPKAPLAEGVSHKKNAWGHQVTFRMSFESVRDLPRTSGCKGYSSLFYTGIEWVSWVISEFTVVLLVFPKVAL